MLATINLNIFCLSVFCLEYNSTIYLFRPNRWEETGGEEIEITGNSVNTIFEQKLLEHSKEGGHRRDRKHVTFFLGDRIREEKSWKTEEQTENIIKIDF